MTAEEFKRRYIARLTVKLATDGWQPDAEAAKMAEDSYARCPFNEIDQQWQNDPEGAADEDYLEWVRAGQEDLSHY